MVDVTQEDGDERQPLLRSVTSTSTLTSKSTLSNSTIETTNTTQSTKESVSRTLRYTILFAGDFIANLDTSFVIATCGYIASEFGQATLGSWIMVSYNVGYSVALPLYGAFGERYGSLPPLLVAYLLFGVGCIVSGLAGSLWTMALGRALSGAGGAGMAAMVSFLIAETAQPNEVENLRSYVNLVAVIGRSSGGPIGGLITDAFGWRWSSIGQVPFVLVCWVCVVWLWTTASSPSTQLNALPVSTLSYKSVNRHRPINFTSSFLLSVTLLSFLVALSMLGNPNLWHLELMGVSLSLFLLAGTGLVAFDMWCTKTPLIPFRKMNIGLGLQMLIQFLLLFAQFSIVSNAATYFARTQNATTETAALHLIPVAVGNAGGALLAGKVIQHTKKHHYLGAIGLSICSLGFFLMAFRWSGKIGNWESLYIVLPSLGVGILSSVQFVALTKVMSRAQMGSCVSLFLLSQQAGIMIGVSGSAAILQVVFRNQMSHTLEYLPNIHQLVDKVLNHTRYAFELPTETLERIISSYCQGFRIVCLVAGITSVALQAVLVFAKE